MPNIVYRVFLYPNEEIIDMISSQRTRPERGGTTEIELTDYLVSFDYDEEIEKGVVIKHCKFTLANSFGVFTSSDFSPDDGYGSDPRFSSTIEIKKGMSISIVEDSSGDILYHGKVDDVNEGEDELGVITYDYFLTWRETYAALIYINNAFVRTPVRWTTNDPDGYLKRLEYMSEVIKDILYTSTSLDFLYQFDLTLTEPDVELVDFYLELNDSPVLEIIQTLAQKYNLIFYIEPGLDVSDYYTHTIKATHLVIDDAVETPLTYVSDINYEDVSTEYVVESQPVFTINEENIKNSILIKTESQTFPVRDWESIKDYGERILRVDAKTLEEEEAITYARQLLKIYSKRPYSGSFKLTKTPDSNGEVDNSTLWDLKSGFTCATRYPRLGIGTDITYENLVIDSISIKYDGRMTTTLGVASSYLEKEDILRKMGIEEDEEESATDQGEDDDVDFVKNITIEGNVLFKDPFVYQRQASALASWEYYRDFSITPFDLEHWDTFNVALDRRSIPSFYLADGGIPISDYKVISGTPNSATQHDYLNDTTYAEKLSIIHQGSSENTALRFDGIAADHALYIAGPQYGDQNYATLFVDIYSSVDITVLYGEVDMDTWEIRRRSQIESVGAGGWQQLELHVYYDDAGTIGGGWAAFALFIDPETHDTEWDIMVSNMRLAPIFENGSRGSDLKHSTHSAPNDNDRLDIRFFVDMQTPFNSNPEVTLPEYVYDIESSIRFTSFPNVFGDGVEIWRSKIVDENQGSGSASGLEYIGTTFGAVGLRIMSEDIQYPSENGIVNGYWNGGSPPSGTLGDRVVCGTNPPPAWVVGQIHYCNGGTSWTPEGASSKGEIVVVQHKAPYFGVSGFYQFWDNSAAAIAGWEYESLYPKNFTGNWFYRKNLLSLSTRNTWTEPGVSSTSQIILEDDVNDAFTNICESGKYYHAHYSHLENLHAIGRIEDRSVDDSILFYQFHTPFLCPFNHYNPSEVELNIYGVTSPLGSQLALGDTVILHDTDILRRRLFQDDTAGRRPSISGQFTPASLEEDVGTTVLGKLDGWFERRKLTGEPIYALLSTSDTPTASNSIVAPVIIKETFDFVIGEPTITLKVPVRGWAHLSSPATELTYIDGSTLYSQSAEFTHLFICNAFYYFDPSYYTTSESASMRYNVMFEFPLDTPIDYDDNQYGRVLECGFTLASDTATYAGKYSSEHTLITTEGLRCIASRILRDTTQTGEEAEYSWPISTMSAGINFFNDQYDYADETATSMQKPFIKTTVTGRVLGSAYLDRGSLQRRLTYRGIIEDPEKYDYIREIGLSTGLDRTIQTHPLAFRGNRAALTPTTSQDRKTLEWDATVGADFTADITELLYTTTSRLHRRGDDVIRYYPRKHKLYSPSSLPSSSPTSFEVVRYDSDLYTGEQPYQDLSGNQTLRLNRIGDFTSIACDDDGKTYSSSPTLEDCIRINGVQASTARVLVPKQIFEGRISLESPEDLNAVGGSPINSGTLPAILRRPFLSELKSVGADVTGSALPQLWELDNDILKNSAYFQTVLSQITTKTDTKWAMRKGFFFRNSETGKLQWPKKLGFRFYRKKTTKEEVTTDILYDYRAPFVLVALPITEDIDVSTLHEIEISLRGGGYFEASDGSVNYNLCTYILNNKNNIGESVWEKVEGLSGNITPDFMYTSKITGSNASDDMPLSNYISSDRLIHLLFLLPLLADEEGEIWKGRIMIDALTARAGEVTQKAPLRQGIDYLYNWYQKNESSYWSASELTQAHQRIIFPNEDVVTIGDYVYNIRSPKITTATERYQYLTPYNTNAVELSSDAFFTLKPDEDILLGMSVSGAGALSSETLVKHWSVFVDNGNVVENEEDWGGAKAKYYQIMPANSTKTDTPPDTQDSYNQTTNVFSVGYTNALFRDASLISPARGNLFGAEIRTAEINQKYTLSALTLSPYLSGANVILDDGFGNSTYTNNDSEQDALKIASYAKLQMVVPSAQRGIYGLVMTISRTVDHGTSETIALIIHYTTDWKLWEGIKLSEDAFYFYYSLFGTGIKTLASSISGSDDIVVFPFNPEYTIIDIKPYYKDGTGFRTDKLSSSSKPVLVEQLYPVDKIPANTTVNITGLTTISPTYEITYDAEEGFTVMRTTLVPGSTQPIKNIFSDEMLYITQQLNFNVEE